MALRRRTAMTAPDRLRQAFAARTARVGVAGAARDRLPLARAFAAAGFPTVDCDPDQPAEADAVVLTAAAVLTAAHAPDTGALDAAARVVARRLRPGQLVVLTGPTPPGTTRAVVLPLLAAGGLAAGRDFFLAYSPEGESGSDRPAARIVGGFDPGSLAAAAALFEQIAPAVTRVSSLEAAELGGLAGPAIRAVHAAAANELKRVCDRMGVDVWEVLGAIRPAGSPAPAPGPGGRSPHPSLLARGARRYGAAARLVELAGEVNAAMPAFVVAKLADALNDAGKPVKGSRVAILGRTSKEDADGGCGPPVAELMGLLLGKGAVVTCHDPHAPELPRPPDGPHPGTAGSALTAEYLAAQDGVLLATDHPALDYAFIVAHSRLVIDTRNATKAVTAGRDKIVRA